MAQAVEVLRAQGVVDDGQRDRLLSAAQVPWWLMLLQTLAAWVASLLILSSFMLPLSLLVYDALVRALAGVALCAVAVVLFFASACSPAQMALAFSLAGQALVVSATGSGWGAFFDGGRLWAATGLVVAAAMMWPRSTSLQQPMCAVSVSCGGADRRPDRGWRLMARAWRRLSPCCGCRDRSGRVHATGPGWRRCARWCGGGAGPAGHRRRRGGRCLALRACGRVARRRRRMRCRSARGWCSSPWSLTSRRRARRARAWPALAAALVLAIGVATGAGAAGREQPGARLLPGRTSRDSAALALAAAVAYVGEYYYRLDTTLLVKSALMAISGGGTARAAPRLAGHGQCRGGLDRDGRASLGRRAQGDPQRHTRRGGRAESCHRAASRRGGRARAGGGAGGLTPSSTVSVCSMRAASCCSSLRLSTALLYAGRRHGPAFRDRRCLAASCGHRHRAAAALRPCGA